jgi:hypothetical protein
VKLFRPATGAPGLLVDGELTALLPGPELAGGFWAHPELAIIARAAAIGIEVRMSVPFDDPHHKPERSLIVPHGCWHRKKPNRRACLVSETHPGLGRTPPVNGHAR